LVPGLAAVEERLVLGLLDCVRIESSRLIREVVPVVVERSRAKRRVRFPVSLREGAAFGPITWRRAALEIGRERTAFREPVCVREGAENIVGPAHELFETARRLPDLLVE
jgi:hypothetical protein